MSDARPKVSVVMITYNHERFIEQAVRSVMMQETDFEYELIIGEDCSTDSTREIVLGLKEEFPEKIRLILHPQNVGMIPNFVSVLNAAEGEYVALCEGDDYWTDARKLQIQVDYMDAHPECRLCFHSAQVVYEDSPDRFRATVEPRQSEVVGLQGWLRQRSRSPSYIATATILFRQARQKVPAWYNDLRFAGDWPLIVWLLSSGGGLGYVDDAALMTVRRIHSGGTASGLPSRSTLKRRQALLDDMSDHVLVRSHLKRELHRYLRSRIGQIHLRLVSNYLETHDLAQARKHYLLALIHPGSFTTLPLRRHLALLIRCISPSIYRLVLSPRGKGQISP